MKLARKYGGDLLCVRYRLDADGSYRYTTVELIVDCVPVVKRPGRIVAIRVHYEETALRSTVPARGRNGTGQPSSGAFRIAWP